MKKEIVVLFLFFMTSVLMITGCSGCEEDKKSEQEEFMPEAQGENTDPVGYQVEKAQNIFAYNIEERKKRAVVRTPCDTIALMEHILRTYPPGTYLVDLDPRYTYSIPQSAVIYQKALGGTYVYALVAKSRAGERLVEPKNLIGYDASFIDLDSTKLGTAFFYLTLFRCTDSSFTTLWESTLPNHGGFNTLTMKKWKNTPYVEAYFHYARGIGRLEYNFFMIDSLTKPPHLLLTIETINRKRSVADINGDKYPDYYENFYLDTGDRIVKYDSVGFVWRDSLYYSIRDKNKTTKY